MEIKKLGWAYSPKHLIVEKKWSKDSKQYYYNIHASKSSVFYFFLMLPGLGNILALIFWIAAILDKKYIISGKKDKDKNIVFSSV